MMKRIILMMILLCAMLFSMAQSNFVKNPGLEDYSNCPFDINQINYCKHWSILGDSTTTLEYCMEYYNECGNAYPDIVAHVPDNGGFYQYAKSGKGFAGGHFYYDKSSPPPPGILPFNYRDNLVGRLHKNLSAGKVYCVSFWVNMAESSGVGHNKIGAYLDDGTIHTLPDTLGQEISTVKPQVFSNTVIADTGNWVKIQGSFTAKGDESYISIGNFFPNDSVTTVVANYWFFGTQYSYYLIDDVSVIPIDLAADAGKDNWVEIGKKVKIGRVGDTTAEGLDCKWYHKGALIDSGAIITVNANSVVNAIDTYVVVQTVCGLVKTDTVMVKTTGLGILPQGSLRDDGFTIYPNPSNGTFIITSLREGGTTTKQSVKIYDLLGRIVQQQNLSFNNKEATIKLSLPSATYILELKDEAGNVQRERIVIE